MTSIMPRPVVHIGYHKTATTYLQTSVFSNKDVFQVPWRRDSAMAVEAFVLEHPERFSAIRTREAFAALCDMGSRQIPVISSEELSGNPMKGRYDMDRVAGRLHSTFPEARILIGIREQNAAILSNYYQYVRQGGVKSLMYLLTTTRQDIGYRPTMRLDHFEYDLTIQHYQRLFGTENVLALPIELLRQKPEDYCDRLRKFLGTDKQFPLPQKVVNARRTEFSMGLERRLNALVASPEIRAERYHDNPLAFRIKNRFLRGTDTILNRLGVQGSSKLRDEISKFVGNYFEDSNTRTSQLIGEPLDKLGYRVSDGQTR